MRVSPQVSPLVSPVVKMLILNVLESISRFKGAILTPIVPIGEIEVPVSPLFIII